MECLLPGPATIVQKRVIRDYLQRKATWDYIINMHGNRNALHPLELELVYIVSSVHMGVHWNWNTLYSLELELECLISILGLQPGTQLGLVDAL